MTTGDRITFLFFMEGWERTADVHKADGTYDLAESWTFFEACRGAKEAVDKDRRERGEGFVRQTELARIDWKRRAAVAADRRGQPSPKPRQGTAAAAREARERRIGGRGARRTQARVGVPKGSKKKKPTAADPTGAEKPEKKSVAEAERHARRTGMGKNEERPVSKGTTQARQRESRYALVEGAYAVLDARRADLPSTGVRETVAAWPEQHWMAAATSFGAPTAEVFWTWVADRQTDDMDLGELVRRERGAPGQPTEGEMVHWRETSRGAGREQAAQGNQPQRALQARRQRGWDPPEEPPRKQKQQAQGGRVQRLAL